MLPTKLGSCVNFYPAYGTQIQGNSLYREVFHLRTPIGWGRVVRRDRWLLVCWCQYVLRISHCWLFRSYPGKFQFSIQKLSRWIWHWIRSHWIINGHPCSCCHWGISDWVPKPQMIWVVRELRNQILLIYDCDNRTNYGCTDNIFNHAFFTSFAVFSLSLFFSCSLSWGVHRSEGPSGLCSGPCGW